MSKITIDDEILEKLVETRLVSFVESGKFKSLLLKGIKKDILRLTAADSLEDRAVVNHVVFGNPGSGEKVFWMSAKDVMNELQDFVGESISEMNNIRLGKALSKFGGQKKFSKGIGKYCIKDVVKKDLKSKMDAISNNQPTERDHDKDMDDVFKKLRKRNKKLKKEDKAWDKQMRKVEKRQKESDRLYYEQEMREAKEAEKKSKKNR